MKKKSFIIFLLPFILILTSCIIVTAFDYNNREQSYNYSTMVDTDKALADFSQSYTLEYDLLRFVYALDYNSKYDLNLSNEKNLRNLYGEDLSNYSITQLDDFITQANSDLQYNYPFLNYHIISSNGENEYSNHGNIPLDNNTNYVYRISFDEQGNISLTGNDKFDVPIKTVYTNLIRSTFNFTYASGTNEVVSLLKDCVFTFEIDKSADVTNILTYNNNYSFYADTSTHISTILISFAVVGILALCLPLKRLRQFNFYQIITDIPLEISFFTSIGFLSYSGSYIAATFFYNSPLSVMLYSILLFLFIMDILIFKYMMQYPPILYFKDKTLTSKSINFVVNQIKQFDLTDRSNLPIFQIICVNAIAIVILPLWFDFFGLIIYCVILFIVLISIMNRIKKDYQSLLEVTSSIASGKFDKTTNTDLGVFNSYKDSMDTIRDDFKEAVDNEIRSEKMKTELITSVSHDLKTPLTSIVTYADLLKDENLDNDKKTEYIDVIDRNALRLKNLINDLFEVSKASSGNVTLNLMDIDLISLLKQALLEYDHLFEKNGLDIKFASNMEKAILQLDSQKTYRIITNLLVNISKYAMENTRVYIDINKVNQEIQITLKNISKYEIQVAPTELLERFVQGDSSRHSEGSGLGLAIAKTFTELQGGNFDIAIDGDLFKVTLSFKAQKES